ncbi:MAG TPA: hypothetical protein VGR00_03940, partial [Thermoanaerobaculia bacterium]|nr:hypothetical protein [Thermoanaerobaculia bacterium]
SRGGPARDVTHEGDPPGGHGAPTFSRDGKKIFFVVTDPKFDNATLFSVGVDGKGLARHFTFPRLFDPVIAPDGTTVLFGGGSAQLKYDIWRASLAPGKSQQAPVPLGVTGVDVPRHLALSPDGRRLAFSGLSTIGNIWSQPVDSKSFLASGPARALTKGGGTRNTWPVVSPDGKHIAFGRQEPGSSHDVWVMDASGENAHAVTSDPAVDFVQDWFPSGRELLVTSNRSGEFRLYVADLSAGKVSPFSVSMKEMATPRLSPDGKSLAFGSRKGGITLNTWVMDVGSGKSKALTFDRELFAYPCWSPDGKLLAAEVKRGDDVHVAVVPVAGGQPEQLTSDTGLSWAFSFSPDGDKIAFAGYRRGFWNVWWVSRQTREQKRLTSFEKLNAFVRYPSWSRAGDQIVFEYAETTGNLWSLEFPQAAGSGR